MATVDEVIKFEVSDCDETLGELQNAVGMASGADTGPQLVGGLKDAQSACQALLRELATALAAAEKAEEQETEEMADAGE